MGEYFVKDRNGNIRCTEELGEEKAEFELRYIKESNNSVERFRNHFKRYGFTYWSLYQPTASNVDTEKTPLITEYLKGVEFDTELTSTVAFSGEHENMVVLLSDTSALEQAKACIYTDIIGQYENAISHEAIKENVKIEFKETLLYEDSTSGFVDIHKYYEVCVIVTFSLQKEVRTYMVDVFTL